MRSGKLQKTLLYNLPIIVHIYCFKKSELMRCIGKEDDIEVVTEAFLIENAVDFSDFKEEVSKSTQL